MRLQTDLSESEMYAICPDCNSPFRVTWEHNGVMPVLHGQCCSWAQAYMHPDDCFETYQQARDAVLTSATSRAE